MKKYLIDTNTCIYFIKGKFELNEKFEKADPENCFISEITLAELKFGVENSEKKEKNQKVLENFLTGIKVIPIFHSLDLYATIGELQPVKVFVAILAYGQLTYV